MEPVVLQVGADGYLFRLALALSSVTGRPIESLQFDECGLKPRHVGKAAAFATLCRAGMFGAAAGSTELVFEPTVPLSSGLYRLCVSDACCPDLAMLAVPCLAGADQPTTVILEGQTYCSGTSSEYVEAVWLGLLRRAGLVAAIHNPVAGFECTGEMHLHIAPSTWNGFDLLRRGEMAQLDAYIAVTDMPDDCIRDCVAQLGFDLSSFPHRTHIRRKPGPRPGLCVTICCWCDHGAASFHTPWDGVCSYELAVADACHAFKEWWKSEFPISPQLARDLILPLALAAGPSNLPVPHLDDTMKRALEMIELFLGVKHRYCSGVLTLNSGSRVPG